MIHKNLALKIFEGFSIERWNDLVRPFALIEMDKAAEKMVLAYIIGKFEEHAGHEIDWEWLIYGSFFDLLRKIALCDIKSPVQRMIREQFPEEYQKLNEWVIEQYADILGDEGLMEMFRRYVNRSTAAAPSRTERVLRAAHKFSTMREFEMIAPANERSQLDEIEKGLSEDIEEYLDLRGLQLLITKQKPYRFLIMIEKLRFQTRWNQTPRIPKTSVLGHSFFVATLTLLMSRDIRPVPGSGKGICARRLFCNFFSALFHDLPEAVTRDIISHVKQATDGLPSIVKTIEDKIVKQELLPLMEDFYQDELLYFTNDEFSNRVRDTDGSVQVVSFEQLNKDYNSDEWSPADGKLVRAADHIAAFLEADRSIHYGITSRHLEEGRNNLLKLYPAGTLVNGMDVAGFFAEFCP